MSIDKSTRRALKLNALRAFALPMALVSAAILTALVFPIFFLPTFVGFYIRDGIGPVEFGHMLYAGDAPIAGPEIWAMMLIWWFVVLPTLITVIKTALEVRNP